MPNSPPTPLSDNEVALLRALSESNVKFMVVGMSAAILQGADASTKDIDLWFKSLADPGLDIAVRSIGGILAWRSSPPMIIAPDVESIDLVYGISGVGSFDSEYKKAITISYKGIPLKVMPLERIIQSKQAANRPKDQRMLPYLKDVLNTLNALKK